MSKELKEQACLILIDDASSIIIRIEELVADGNYRILDDKDYREEYVGMLRNIDHILKNYDTKNVLNSCTIVARCLKDSVIETNFEKTTRNENWMSDREDDEGEQFLFDEGVYAASAYEYESVEELDEWLLNEEVLISDGLGHTTTFTELKKELLELEATKEKREVSGEQVEEPSETNTLGADPDINRYEQIIQEQQASLNLLQSQFVELTKQNELIIEKLNQKSVENTEDNQSMKKVGSSTIELAFDQIPRLIQLSKEKLSDVKNHLKDNIKAKSQKGLSVTLEKLKVLEILESINKGLDSLSQKVQNLDTQLKVLSGKQVNEKELLLLPAPIQEAAEEIIQKKNVKIGEPTRPQNKFEERLAQAKKDNKATAENYANQKQEVEVSQRVYK
ncbi:hypothetical protein [Lactococcus sp. DD01]|uniref:hypothetical protein n=1 Tax=Lactococcus sp. DD01 TaxID=1776443 RepID=UPI00077620CC|nr:hypothetical protein [Lactococcus sp. DD01]